jgi:hypothetical protein
MTSNFCGCLFDSDTRLLEKKPASVLPLEIKPQNIKLVAGAGFEPTTFGL